MVSRLTTAQIASAFFVPERTMGQRTSRAKATLRAAGVDFRAENLATPERLSAVRHILYLVFNEGYACSSGESLTDVSLAAEVIRLVRQLHQAMPDDTETTPGRAGLSSPSTGSEVLPSDRTGLGSTPPTNRSHGTITVTDESLGSVTAAVLGFAAHFVVCASVEPEWAHARLPAGELSAPLSPLSLMALADRLGTEIGSSDAVFASVATGEASDLMLVPDSSTKHRRVARAHRYREGVRVGVTGDRHRLLVLGRGNCWPLGGLVRSRRTCPRTRARPRSGERSPRPTTARHADLCSGSTGHRQLDARHTSCGLPADRQRSAPHLPSVV